MTGFVYICRREHGAPGLLKIGHTDNLARRMSDFDRETGADSRMILEYAVACHGGLRERVERHTHRLARKHRQRGEWFRIDLPAAIRFLHRAGDELNIHLTQAHDNRQARIAALSAEITDFKAELVRLSGEPIRVNMSDANARREMAYAEKRRAAVAVAGQTGVEKWGWLGVLPVVIAAAEAGSAQKSTLATYIAFFVVASILGYLWAFFTRMYFESKANAAYKVEKDPGIERDHAAAVEALAAPVRAVRKAQIDELNQRIDDANSELNAAIEHLHGVVETYCP